MIDILNDISFIASIIQIVLGVLVFAIFRIWLLKEEEMRNTIRLRKERRYEDICESVIAVFNRALNEDIPLRGDGGDHPDIVVSFAKKVVGISNEFGWLKRTHDIIIRLNSSLIITALVGVIFLLVVRFMDSHVYVISIASIAIIVYQIIVFLIIRFKGLKISAFEEI